MKRSLKDWQTKWWVNNLQYYRIPDKCHVVRLRKLVLLPIGFRSEELAHLMMGRYVWHELHGRKTFKWVGGLNAQNVPVDGGSI